MNIELKAFNHLLEITNKDSTFHKILNQNGVIDIPKNSENIFSFMVKLIVKQQLSNKVADVIWNRLLQKAKNNILEYVSLENKSDILACGVSNRKFEAIYRLKNTHMDEKLCININANDIQKSKEYILSLYGFESWSAEMISLFYLKDSNVWSANDATLKKATTILKLDNDYIKNSSPYSSYLALHLWKAIDNKLI